MAASVSVAYAGEPEPAMGARLLALVMAIEALRTADKAEHERQLRLIDAHAAKIQAWHGLPRTSIIPGTGWHKVRKNAVD